MQNKAGMSSALADSIELVGNAGSLVDVNYVVPRSNGDELTVRRTLDGLDGFLTVRVLRQKLSRHRVEHHPLSSDSSHQHKLAIRRKLNGLDLLSDILAPYDGMRQSIPELKQTIASPGDELRHVWMHRESPQLISVAHNDGREAHVEVASENAVLGRSDEQLHSFSLRHHTNRPEVWLNEVLKANRVQILA